MKRVSQIKKILGLWGLLVSAAVWGQPDLSVSTNSPYSFPGDGQSYLIDFTVDNLGNLGAADGITIDFTLNDVNLQFDGSSFGDPAWDCTAIQNSSSCLYQGNLAPAGTTTLQVGIVYPPGTFDLAPALTAVVGDVGGGEVNLANNTASVDIQYNPSGSVDLGINKTFTAGFPTSYSPGDPISFEITVSHLSGPDATNVMVTDDLLVNNIQFDANSSSPACLDTGSVVQCALDILPTGDNVVLTIAGILSPSAQPGNFVNTATVSATEPDPITTNNTNGQGFAVVVGGFPEVSVTKSITSGATQIVQGTTFEYDIQVNNTGIGNALNVDLTDTLPPEVTYINHTNLGNFVCTYTAPDLNCNAASLPNTTAQDGVRILVSADGPISANVVNTATSSYADSNSTDNTSSTAFIIIAPDADLDLTMVPDAPNYTVGDLVTLNLTLHNPFSSTGAPPNTTVVTTLPNEVIYNSAQVSNMTGWACNHDGSPLGGDVTCSSMGNPVPIGTNTFIEIVAVANGVGTAISAFATVTSDFDPNPSNDTANASFEIFPGAADLSIQLTSTSGIYNQGDSIGYDIQVINPAGSTSNPSDTMVDVILPAEVSFTDVDLTGAPGWFCTHDGSPTGGTIVCDRQGAAFLAASTHDMRINVIATTPATAAIIQATISSAADTFPTNNSATQSDVINAVTSDFSISKTVNVTAATIGDPFTYVLTVGNDPASTASPADVLILDTLPVEVSFDSFVIGTNMGTPVTCTHDGSATGGVFSCNTNTAAFPIGEVVTIDVNVTAAAVNPSVINTATVQTTTDPDGTANNNVASSGAVNISVPSTTTLSVSKIAQIAGVPITEVAYGQLYGYELIVTNTGVNDATDVHISDNLPPEVTLMGFNTAGWTCLPLNTNAINQVVDCTLDNPLAPATSTNIILDVMATNDTNVTSITNQMSSLAANAGALVFDTNTVNLLNSDAVLNVTQQPSPVDPGGQVNFDVVFSNSGSTILNGVQIQAILPQGFIYNGFTGEPGLTCVENAGTVNCTYANPLAIGSNILITLDLTSPTVLNNPPYILQISGNAIELANPVVSSISTVFSTSNLIVNMFSDPSQVSPGGAFTHIATISNSGNLPLSNVKAVLAFPDQAQFSGVSSSDMSCAVAGAIITCNNNQVMSPGDSYLISYNFNATNQTGLLGTSLSVNADGLGRAASATTQVINNIFENDLSLIKTASETAVQQRDFFSYEFVISNVGTTVQTGIRLSDQLPEGVLFQSFTGNSWNCDGANLIDCQFTGSLNSGESTQLVFNVVAPDSVGFISNTATVESDIDENPSNNQSSVIVDVGDGQGGGTVFVADLSIDLTTSASEFINTEEITWQINLTNEGPDSAHGIVIESTFPSGFNATEVLVDNDLSCILLSESLVCELNSLAKNETAMVELRGGFNPGFTGMMINMVSVNADSVDPIAMNNQSQVQVDVIDAGSLQADLGLEFQADFQNIRQGQTFEMTINTSNNGPDSAFESVLNTDVGGLISQIQIMNSGQWVCQSAGQSVNCQFPGAYPSGLNQSIGLLITTQQVVQISEPIQINSLIESSAMDPHPGNNMVSFSNDVRRTPTEDEIFTLFEDAIGSGASETVLNTIRSVSSYCARSFFMAIEGLCEEMIASARAENREAIINAMEEMTPNEVIGQSTSAAEIMASQFRNVSSRLSQLRGGGGSGVSVAGLTARYGNESLPLGLLAYLNQSEDESENVSNINDFISPWGFFVNGNISMGERDATGRELGFDFDTYGLTAGVDYRFSPTKVAGVALGYANFDSEIEDEAEMKSTGFTLTGYGSFYVKDNFYVDARISYAKPDFEQKRRINFQLDNIAIDRIATGKTDANQYTVAMSMGYHFNKNSWNITPNASFRYTRTTIDDFMETGAGDFNFRFGEQEVKSMVWSFGTSISKAISLKNGVLSPQFDVNISRETENDGGFVEARFINAPDDEIFLLQTDEPDRTYGSAGLGLVFIGANGKQAYINYKSIFGLDGFTRGTINLGARFEF